MPDDLFVLSESALRHAKEWREAHPRQRGHAAPPGTGPAGETCRTCKWLRKVNGGRRVYSKCGLGRISAGPGTDIRLKDPACRHWERTDA
jgi:hypothetical protein